MRVKDIPLIAPLLFPIIIRWCPHVTEIPLLIRRIVLKRGSPIGLIVSIPRGGQECPIKIEGEREKWKKAQNKEKKSIISLNTNRQNLNLRLSNVCREYSPLFASQIIFFLHDKIQKQKRGRIIKRGVVHPVFKVKISEDVSPRVLIPREQGQREL